MADPNTPRGADESDDTYIIEDTSGSVEELEREMLETANEAAGEIGSDGLSVGSEASLTVTDEALREENERLRNRVLRTLADYENFRKRTEREKADFFKYAVANVMKEILPVLDNFDRALDHAEERDDFHKGVLLIYKQLFDVLRKNGLTPIDEAGVRFDPNIHEAVVRDENDSVPSHTVVEVLQKGYFLYDRLLRPALVKVAVGGPDER